MISFLKKNAFYVMALVLVAGILAVSGIAGFVSGQRDREMAENAAEFTDKTAAAEEADMTAEADANTQMADEMTGYNADVVQKILSMIEDGTLALEDFEDENSMITGDVLAAEDESIENGEMDAEETVGDEAEMAGTIVNAGYKMEDGMAWPVEGEIVLDYSMDATTYYPTLQQYKCNPAILIQSEAGTAVTASYGGTVLDIYEDAELGTVVETSLGNGYEAFYGQLENVSVAVGDTIEEGQVIGEVAVPTRYYSVEGSHLNFRLTKDGEPVDPLDYLN
ncbi:MAG: peptidoglycan DD-metalloendopeptidase family protein [Coprococcus sp.]